jgi:hypothetical protein
LAATHAKAQHRVAVIIILKYHGRNGALDNLQFLLRQNAASHSLVIYYILLYFCMIEKGFLFLFDCLQKLLERLWNMAYTNKNKLGVMRFLRREP